MLLNKNSLYKFCNSFDDVLKYSLNRKTSIISKKYILHSLHANHKIISNKLDIINKKLNICFSVDVKQYKYIVTLINSIICNTSHINDIYFHILV